MTEQPIYDFYSPGFKAQAYSAYAKLRAQSPLYLQSGGYVERTWYVLGHDEAEMVLRDHKRFVKNFRNTRTPEERAQMPPLEGLGRLLDNHMLNTDGSDHTRLRALVSKAFSPSIVNAMQDRVQTIADELLDRVQGQGQMDLIDEYAFPLPIVVIAELLGIPAHDRERFRVWSNAFIEPSFTEEEWKPRERLLTEFVEYIGQIFAARRKEPQADLITALLQAEEAGDHLNEEELYSMVVLLIVAGHETTVNLIGNGTLALLQNPAQLALLSANPSLIPNAVEELLRYDGPVEIATMRFAAEDLEIAGQQIRRGDAVVPVLASASHDAALYAAPDTLDVSRENLRHLAFGFGVHYCVGAPLARMEGRIAFASLLRRLPNLRLAAPVEQLSWRPNFILRGLHHLPVAWG